MASSPPAPAPRPLFYSPSPPPKTPEPGPSSPTSPLPRRRLPVSPRTSAKRSPAGSKPWTRRLNLGSPAASVRAPAAAGSSTISPDQVGAELGASSSAGKAERATATATGVSPSDTFNLTTLAKELDDIAAAAQAAPPTFTSKFFASAHSLKAPVKAPTRINDLPDEILLRIFGFLDDQLGHRARLTRVPGLPEWSSPPLRIARVCKRWLPLARYLCYRSMRIAHLSRISALHRAFTLNPELATQVRHLVIEFPATSGAKDLEQVVDAPAKVGQPGSSGREPDSEADSQSRPATPSTTDEITASDSPTRSMKKKKTAIPPPTYADQLRSVFQSCAFLLSLEIVGIPPATLFAASSAGTTSSLHRLHQLRLSTVASLTLRASDDAEPLKAVALRDALLALTGLRRLALKGYASALDEETDKLDFSPTKTSLGLVARPLPTRTRSSRLLPLERLELVECSFSPADLEALLRHCRPKTLRRLAVEDRYTSARARQLRELGFSHTPTVEALSTVVDLVKDSVVSLKVSLYNYPLLVGGDASVAMLSGNASTAPQSGSTSRRVTGKTRPPPPHVLDDFVAQLEHLQVLDVGGTVVTPALFEANPDANRPSSSTFPKHLPARLPPPSRTLTIRACPLLTPPALLPFLTSLGPLPSRLRDPNSTTSRLATLNTVGGSEHGWSRSTNTWAIQQACWTAGVKWSSGASRAVTAGDGEIDSPKFWVQGYGPASRTGGVW